LVISIKETTEPDAAQKMTLYSNEVLANHGQLPTGGALVEVTTLKISGGN